MEKYRREDYVNDKRLLKNIYIDDPLTDDLEEILGNNEGVNLDSLIHKLQDIKNKYQEKKIKLDISWYDGDIGVSIFDTRLETDEEYKRRIKEEEKEYREMVRRLERDEAYREELLRLKEKYGYL